MTREELKRHCLKQIENCELILELLEQESFINKPCVSSGVCKHDKNKILDRVRDEILDNAFSVVNPKNTYEYINVIDLDSIDEILDKYKAGSEDKE